MRVVWTTAEWADAIQTMPLASVLVQRRVLVPNSRVAHALRRELVERDAPGALIGTRFLNVIQLAQELLADAGQPVPLVNHRELGPRLVHEAFSQVEFVRFRRDDLLTLPGWDEAFVRTLSDLDACLLSPRDLRGEDPHVADVGRVHAFVRERGELVTTGRLLQLATEVAGAVAARSPTLAVVTGFESRAEIELLRALPDVAWARWGARPYRAKFAQRTGALLGPQLDDPGASVPPQQQARTALEHLQGHLFDERAAAAAPPDDSVSVAIYAGVHEEVAAAVSWVVQQILERGVQAGDIAILSANAEPYGALLRARLASLPWSREHEPTFSERGIPLTERADGARLLCLVRALQDGLSTDALAPLLQILRASDPELHVRGLSRAWELLNELGANGGSRHDLRAGGNWGEVWRRSQQRLSEPSVPGAELDPRDLARRSGLQSELAALAPAVDSLVTLLDAVVANEGLLALWTRLAAFAQKHLRLPFAAPPVTALIDGICKRFVGDGAHEPTGADALDWLEDTILESVAKVGRFGEPRVYLGTLAGVRGLAFAAVRVVGLVEGSVPSAAREDPVLPDDARAALSSLLPTSAQRAHRQLAAFDDAVRSARERLVLTAPRVSAEGSSRQPAAVLLDVMRALTGGNDRLEDKLAEAAAAGRERERKFRERSPVSPEARLARIAQRDTALAREELNPALALDALRAIRDRKDFGAQDGILPGVIPLERIAGLSPERPISASRLEILLSCPHHFLYDQIFGFGEPKQPFATHSLDLMSFGTFLHAIAEEFWGQHGARLAARDGTGASHLEALRALACQRFDELRTSYPFANEAAARATLEELCDQLTKLFELDWNHEKARTLVAVERAFGFAEECKLETDAGPLYVRGFIDRLDLEGDTLLVRDIKTGKSKPRKADDPPDVGVDLQLGVYAAVAKRMARAWNTPSRVGVAYIYLRSGEIERSWIGPDYARLETATQEWLATAREALQHGAFVRSPNPDDCTFCPHKPVCKPEMARAPEALDDPRVPRRLALLKAVEQS